jgi:hypothetical protein
MSIPVDVQDLAAALAGFGAGYLLTTGGDGRVKAVTVEPEVVDGVLVVTGPGRGSRRNIAENPVVTVLFPPTEPRGFTLLVDGTAELDGEDARVTAAGAVLHRPSSHSDGPPPPDGCGHDCRPVG